MNSLSRAELPFFHFSSPFFPRPPHFPDFLSLSLFVYPLPRFLLPADVRRICNDPALGARDLPPSLFRPPFLRFHSTTFSPLTRSLEITRHTTGIPSETNVDPVYNREGGGREGSVRREDRATLEEPLNGGTVQQGEWDHSSEHQTRVSVSDSGGEAEENDEEEDPTFESTLNSTYLTSTIHSRLHHSGFDSGSTDSQPGYRNSQASSLPTTNSDFSIRDMSSRTASSSPSLLAEDSQTDGNYGSEREDEVGRASEEDEEPASWVRNLTEQALTGDRTLSATVSTENDQLHRSGNSGSVSPVAASGEVTLQIAGSASTTTSTQERSRPSPQNQDSASSLSPYVTVADGPLARLSAKQQVSDSRSVSAFIVFFNLLYV